MSSSLLDVGDALNLTAPSMMPWRSYGNTRMSLYSPFLLAVHLYNPLPLVAIPQQWLLLMFAALLTSSAHHSKHPGVKHKAQGNGSEPDLCSTSKAIINLMTATAVKVAPSDREPSDNYDSIQAMADTDNQACLLKSHPHFHWNSHISAATFRPQAECTVDVQLIFHHDKNYIHPIMGQIWDGHWCLIWWSVLWFSLFLNPLTWIYSIRDNIFIKDAASFFWKVFLPYACTLLGKAELSQHQ